MLCSVVVPLKVACHGIVTGVVADLRIFDPVTVAAVAHIGVDICLIVAEVDGLGPAVARRIVAPIPGRHPGMVLPHAKVCEDAGLCVEHGSDEEGRTIDERSSDDLDVETGKVRVLNHQRGHILEDVVPKYCLDDEEVVVPFHGLHNPEVIDETVPVEVQVRDHVRRVVEEVFEFTYV